MNIQTVSTTPYHDQQSGTSGLRKKTIVFEQSPHYLANFIQSSLNVMSHMMNIDKNQPIFIGGDARYYNETLIQQTIYIILANGFSDIRVGQYGFLSTPAASHLIRHYSASMAFIFSASHNPGGAKGDVGIKINVSNGGPSSMELTEAIFAETQKISQYFIENIGNIDVSVCTGPTFNDARISVVDSVADYAMLMQKIFDFNLLGQYLRKNRLCFDAMHAITGPYAKAIFNERLGMPDCDIINAVPKPDFGGGHPDPSPATAQYIYHLSQSEDCPYALLVASDGDGDRNMILGKGIFINPSDSLAMILAYADKLPFYQNTPMEGVARSLPTSRALDVVAKDQGINCYVTPVGWKFFGNLLDSGKIGLCGEESFSTSGSHIREKDGIWSVLCWASILAVTGKTVAELAKSHWQRYGRHYYCRYDFEGLKMDNANQLFTVLNQRTGKGLAFKGEKMTFAGQFDYTDPIDCRVTKAQGYEAVFSDKYRFVVRLSGTGTSGTTLRLYLEVFDQNANDETLSVVKPLADWAIEFIQIERYCGVNIPSHIV
ncbi:MAG: alpha-D-glucose phosphate-specific phosphoglucomutase [Ostreibacterium sp.]